MGRTGIFNQFNPQKMVVNHHTFNVTFRSGIGLDLPPKWPPCFVFRKVLISLKGLGSDGKMGKPSGDFFQHGLGSSLSSGVRWLVEEDRWLVLNWLGLPPQLNHLPSLELTKTSLKIGLLTPKGSRIVLQTVHFRGIDSLLVSGSVRIIESIGS